MKLKIIIVALMALFSNVVNAQTISGEELKQRYRLAYDELVDYMEQMSDANNSIEKRQESMSLALNLFYCKGETYTEDGVMMPVPKIVFKSNGRKSVITIKGFFNGLVRGIYKSNLAITDDIPIPSFPADIDISSLQQVNDSIFTLETYVSQQFSGYKDGRMVYTDMTAKKTKVYLSRKNVNGKDVFTPLLTGDIYVVEQKVR